MGGRIWVDSEVGKGSTFHVEVELAAALATEDRPRAPAPAGAAARPQQILHVDDSEESRAIVVSFLKGSPHRIEAVENGQAALERLRSGPVDLVLMDLCMPGEDGHALTRRIRAWEAQERRRPVPIVAFTADATAASRRLAREAGVDAYLTKPIGRRAFVDFIDRFVGGATSAADAPDPEMDALVAKYRRSRRSDLQAILEALPAGDYPRIRQLGHNMKGSGAAYGFAEITRLGDALVTAAEREDVAAIRGLVGDIDAALA
jgi:CheY-like chemotaxis protein